VGWKSSQMHVSARKGYLDLPRLKMPQRKWKVIHVLPIMLGRRRWTSELQAYSNHNAMKTFSQRWAELKENSVKMYANSTNYISEFLPIIKYLEKVSIEV
jgi:hypothetical protein